jgi:uncharacterized membrane protein YhaH (DUF805 family)
MSAIEPSQVNPYATPKSAVAEAGPQYEPVKIFSISGRIGRARYITYSIGMYFLCVAAGAALGVLVGPPGTMLGMLAAVVIAYMLTMQRCHDFNTTGWLALVMFVPLVNLMFWFIPGTQADNRFGKPTPPNSVLTLVLVWIFPLLAVLGILAAVAVPAYHDYVKRAQQKQSAPQR